MTWKGHCWGAWTTLISAYFKPFALWIVGVWQRRLRGVYLKHSSRSCNAANPVNLNPLSFRIPPAITQQYQTHPKPEKTVQQWQTSPQRTKVPKGRAFVVWSDPGFWGFQAGVRRSEAWSSGQGFRVWGVGFRVSVWGFGSGFRV